MQNVDLQKHIEAHTIGTRSLKKCTIPRGAPAGQRSPGSLHTPCSVQPHQSPVFLQTESRPALTDSMRAERSTEIKIKPQNSLVHNKPFAFLTGSYGGDKIAVFLFGWALESGSGRSRSTTCTIVQVNLYLVRGTIGTMYGTSVQNRKVRLIKQLC